METDTGPTSSGNLLRVPHFNMDQPTMNDQNMVQSGLHPKPSYKCLTVDTAEHVDGHTLRQAMISLYGLNITLS